MMDEGKTFIFIVTFLGLFFLLMNQMPPGFNPLQTYDTLGYEGFDASTLQNFNFSDSHPCILTFTPGLPPTNTTGEISLSGYSIRISSVAGVGPLGGQIMVEHKTQWFWQWHLMIVKGTDEDMIGFIRANNSWNPNINMSTITVTCPHLTLTVLVSFDTDKYESLEDAWSNNEIACIVGIGYDEALESRHALQLVLDLLTFQSTDLGISPLVNMIINIPIYACIIVLAFILLTKVIPFLGGG